MPHVWNTWIILFQVRASRWILQTFGKFSIGLRPRTSNTLNPFLAFPISISVSLKITALTSLLKKYSPLIFNDEAIHKFQIIKEAFNTSPILSHFTPSILTIVETDASDYALGAVLSQVNGSGKNPIAFDSRKIFPSEIYY
ncbi:hypothetical protein O181_035088 [Austropuccinia psidii MF-1]|uniref:Reverse transcriptase/retrotransposon-derived protein RNase H-like domain-containing protein n=1 Tax=Austropuccinia psidii MF-1 TaxID=1389203 RepID=A0A9Q3D6S9_9BASI|nr:hypothetical protein [Austropuccinia psidii MF-1]